MEEFIGGLWHRFITRAATRSYPQAAVRLESIERTAGILFRALGGDPGLRVAPAGWRGAIRVLGIVGSPGWSGASPSRRRGHPE